MSCHQILSPTITGNPIIQSPSTHLPQWQISFPPLAPTSVNKLVLVLNSTQLCTHRLFTCYHRLGPLFWNVFGVRTDFGSSLSGLQIQREIAVMLGIESCNVFNSVSCTVCVRCRMLLCMPYAETLLLNSPEESTTRVHGIFGEATRGVIVCGFMQKSQEEALWYSSLCLCKDLNTCLKSGSGVRQTLVGQWKEFAHVVHFFWKTWHRINS